MSVDDAASVAEVEVGSNGATVRFQRTFSQPRSAVWAALTEPAQLAAWLDEATVELRVGGTFEIRFGDGTMQGLITELVEDNVLGYSWHEGQDGQSHVRWELSDAPNGGTRLALSHTRLPKESATGFAAGWHHHLERLVALLAGGRLDWDANRFADLDAMYRAG